MATTQSTPIMQSKLGTINPQLAAKISALWTGAQTLKAKEGAKRLEHVCNHYEQLTPETTYRWVDPVGFQHEVEESLEQRVVGWHILRNCVSVLPLILTWFALYLALTGYQKDTYPGDAGKSFLQLWQEGFHGATPLTFSTAALGDVALLTAYFVLIGFTSWLDSRAYVRSTRFAKDLQDSTEELMRFVANTPTISGNNSAIMNVAAAVQQVVNDAMKANQQLIKDVMAVSKQMIDTAEQSMRKLVQASEDRINDVVQISKDSVTKVVQLSEKSIISSNDRIENLHNKKIMPMLSTFDTNVQALQGEIKNYQKRLDDLTDASQKLANVSNLLAVNANSYKQIGQEVSRNIAQLNNTQGGLLQQIGSISKGITDAAGDMNDAAINMGSATKAVEKVASQLDSGIQKTLGTMNQEVKTTMGAMTTEVTKATTTMSSSVQNTVNTMSKGIAMTADVIRTQVDRAAEALRDVAPVLEQTADALDNTATKLSSLSIVGIGSPAMLGSGGSGINTGGGIGSGTGKRKRGPIGGFVGWLLNR